MRIEKMVGVKVSFGMNGKESVTIMRITTVVRDRVSVGQWVIEFRDNNWIYIKDKGWVEFDEKIIRWIR